jgi:hypothetical protein
LVWEWNDNLSKIKIGNRENVPKKGYRATVIPESLYEKLRQYVENSEGRHVSIAEVVRKALWEFLQS